jgi:hypothetical protein
LPASIPLYQGLLLPISCIRNAHTTTFCFGGVTATMDIDDVRHGINTHEAVMESMGIEDKIIHDAVTFINCNYFILRDSELLQDIADQFISNSEDTLVQIDQVRSFISDSLHYIPEIDETPRFFPESLLMRGGDCEDLSVALANLLIYLKDVEIAFLYYYNHINIAVYSPDLAASQSLADKPSIPINNKPFYVIESTNANMEIGNFPDIKPRYYLLCDEKGGTTIEEL